jgi:hypothetical protein
VNASHPATAATGLIAGAAAEADLKTLWLRKKIYHFFKKKEFWFRL